MVNNQSQRAETGELADLITEPLPSNISFFGTPLSALFQLSGVWGYGTQQGDLINPLLFLQNKESRLQVCCYALLPSVWMVLGGRYQLPQV
jgi:hypothetical protein